jgi:hypothetical protein
LLTFLFLGLYSFKYNSLPLGAIKPRGWLHDQISLSAEGLGGHLFDFYRYVNQSLWLGGEYEYSELKEAGPYWFNYIVPLAWTLDDKRLKAQAKAFLDYNLDNQAEDGWLGPEKTRQDRGIWARSLLAFGLTVRPGSLHIKPDTELTFCQSNTLRLIRVRQIGL